MAAERRYQTISVQDAHYQTDCVSNQVRGLVCHDRSQGSYFHVSILPQHRKFVRFAFGGEAYQYRVLPFALSFSPRIFTKCLDAAIAPLRLQGTRILNYINNWLILAQSQQQAIRHQDVIFAHMKELGLRLNAKKMCFLQHRGPLILAWCGIQLRCRHVCLLLVLNGFSQL